MSNGGEADELSAAALIELEGLPQDEAVARLRNAGWWTVASAMSLASWALERAEVEPSQAGRILALAMLIAEEHESPLLLQGQIAYAEARFAVHNGDLVAAENALLRAQESWRSADARSSVARSFLGLTQVLTMQGRYDEAQTAAQSAIVALQSMLDTDPALRMLLARAHRNQATLYVYQEQHAAARDAYRRAADELARFATTLPEDAQADLEEEFGHLALNSASAHTFLDAPDEAERALQDAIARFTRSDDTVNRGRAQTNLGRLYMRLGEYAAALAAFDQANRDLIGQVPLEATQDAETEFAALRRADELLLEHALAYVALNLLPEAARALERCERLFRQTGQPYELAQSRFAQGLLWLQQGQWQHSQTALDEALALYERLNNLFWRNRTQTARARLALTQGDRAGTAVLLDLLLRDSALTTAAGAVAWDLMGLVDVWLLRLHLWLESGEIDEAEAAAGAVEALLGISAAADQTIATMPHLALRLIHARGRIAAARADDAQARRYYGAAVELLDRQRAALPLEEVRTAYLEDKMAIYSDLVLSLLASPLPSEDEVAAAFAVVERARSRALLERLLASVEPTAGVEESETVSAQRAALRRQLHWLYNQLMGEDGNRRLDGGLSREVAQHEAALDQLEWRSAPLLAQAEPVSLAELQARLAPDQQALAYYFAGDEVLAFVVGCNAAQVVRRLTTVQAVTEAQTELRFQLGRVEIGSEYLARHSTRLMRGVQVALARFFEQLVAPLWELIVAPRVLVIPYGLLHLIPFHALWDGEAYWLEHVELSYVPSASIAVRKQFDTSPFCLSRYAGFAPYDAQIPQAQAEIEAAATFFESAQTYYNEAATVKKVREAAATSDVLHLATHGLFRPDNSFFSALKLADGWLDVREIYRLPLAARLVVLSACESGVGQVRAGDEIVGLARGFLAAGAQHLIASLWNVHDRSAAALMQFFYRTLQREQGAESPPVRPAAALRAAQCNALQTGEHPYFWAPFYAVG